MELSPKEEKSIIALSEKHPEVAKLWNKLKEYEQDPAHLFQQLLKKIIKKMSDDTDAAIEDTDNVFTNKDKDNKTFERFMALVTGGEKGFKAMRIGKEDISPEQAAKEKATANEKPLETIALPMPKNKDDDYR